MMKHLHIDRCDSTQDVLKEQLSQDSSLEYLVSCEVQIDGRGRGSNKWSDSEGTLCFSMTIPPHTKPSFTALEMTLLLSKFFEGKMQNTVLKWPNDLLTKKGRKCAGILVQTSGAKFLAGIGVNLFTTSHEFGGIFSSPFPFEKSKWSFDLAKYINEHRYLSTQTLIQDWEKRCFHLGKKVVIKDERLECEGVFNGLGADGEALIQTETGIERIYNGSLRLV